MIHYVFIWAWYITFISGAGQQLKFFQALSLTVLILIHFHPLTNLMNDQIHAYRKVLGLPILNYVNEINKPFISSFMQHPYAKW